MEKWTGELQPPPFWLKPELEVTGAMEPVHLPRGQFIIACLMALLGMGLTFAQALGIAANTMNETGWGRFYRAFNLGGWKIFKNSALNADGSPRRWWRALGNKSSGDPQTCFYRAFSSLKEFFTEWVRVFVPKEGNSRYAKTGQQFWSGEEWFDDLIEAGYKGDVTRRHPDGSIKEHDQIKKTLIVVWCQHVLGVDPDGKWGPKSRAACAAYQKQHGLPETGLLDDVTANALTDQGAPKAIAQVVPLLALNHDPEGLVAEDFAQAA